MRVTKNIREYIEEQVFAKAKQSPKLAELEQKKIKAIEDFQKDKKNAEDMCQVYVDQFVNKYQLDIKGTRPRAYFERCHEHTLPECKEYRKVYEEIHNKARQTVLDIIVELELGGTKAELMEKLNAIEF